ncbi:MAG: hypothetical protein V4450_10395 [Bacteroidota bacterium]
MKISFSYIVIFALVMISCRNKSELPVIGNDTSFQRNGYHSNDPGLTPEGTVFHFLQWYKNNEQWINAQYFIDGGLEDSTTFYHIDFAKAANYIASLRSSRCLSEIYLQDMMVYFSLCNKLMQKYPQKDGPAPGFEFDLVMKSQDYQDIWDSLPNAKLINKRIEGTKATLEIGFTSFAKESYFLSKQGQRWFIDSIGTSFQHLFNSYVSYKDR